MLFKTMTESLRESFSKHQAFLQAISTGNPKEICGQRSKVLPIKLQLRFKLFITSVGIQYYINISPVVSFNVR
jgi:hypothetical protein